MNRLRTFALAGYLFIAAALLSSCASSTSAPTVASTYHIVPPSTTLPYGHSMEEWSAMFCRWFLNMPPNRHPLLGTAPVSEHQTGYGHDGIWFIDGIVYNFTAPIPGLGFRVDTTRTAVVPHGTVFLFALDKIAWDTTGGDPPQDTLLIPSLLSTVQNRKDTLNQIVSADIDGAPVSNIDGYWTTPTLSSITVADSNLYPPGPPSYAGRTFRIAHAGIYLFIDGLSSGNHTFHVRKTSQKELTNIYYRITVQ